MSIENEREKKRIKFTAFFATACLLLNPIRAQQQTNTADDRAARAGKSVVESVRNGDDDKARWSLVNLYSDTTDPSRLSMPIVKFIGFTITLDPNKGRVILAGKHGTDMFEIASAKGEERAACPEYTIAILEASPRHTLMRLHCSPVEYRPNKFRASVTYYLYDAETSMLRAIWRRTASGKDAPVPYAEPDLSLQLLPNGYKFDWVENKAGLSARDRGEAHGIYIRKVVDGKRILTCTDTSWPKSGAFEDGICLAETPARITN